MKDSLRSTDKAGHVTRPVLLGEPVRAVAAVTRGSGPPALVAAPPGRLVWVDPGSGAFTPLARGEYRGLAPLGSGDVLLVLGEEATISAYRLSD